MRGAETGREEGHPLPILAGKLGAATAGMIGEENNPYAPPHTPSLSLPRRSRRRRWEKADPALLFPD